MTTTRKKFFLKLNVTYLTICAYQYYTYFITKYYLHMTEEHTDYEIEHFI